MEKEENQKNTSSEQNQEIAKESEILDENLDNKSNLKLTKILKKRSRNLLLKKKLQNLMINSQELLLRWKIKEEGLKKKKKKHLNMVDIVLLRRL